MKVIKKTREKNPGNKHPKNRGHLQLCQSCQKKQQQMAIKAAGSLQPLKVETAKVQAEHQICSNRSSIGSKLQQLAVPNTIDDNKMFWTILETQLNME